MEEKLYKLIHDAKQLVIVVHQNPDGDAMGSALALYEYVVSRGVVCKVYSPTTIAPVLNWMPYRNEVVVFDAKDKEQISFLDNADTVVFVDHSAAKQAGELYGFIKLTEKKSAFIDHHPLPTLAVDVSHSVVNSAAACCVMYQLLKTWNVAFSKTMASCLYTGICTDTGNFKYGNNLAEAFQIASELMQLGIDREKITDLLFYNANESSLRLLGFVLSEKMKLIDGEIAYITLSHEELQRYDVKKGDTDDIVNYPLAIKGVKVSGIFIEREDCVKISLRSKGNVDVSEIARKYFNGGGHQNASGGCYYGTIDDAVNEYIKQIK